MNDHSGQSRIASFDGRQSLPTWLRVIITRRAMNLSSLKWKSFERLDCSEHLADRASTNSMDATLRRNRYEEMADSCLQEAMGCLTERERVIIHFRYDESLRIVEIARGLSLHPTSVARNLEAAHLKIRKKMISILALKYHLGPAAINECIAELLENPSHSPLMLLKESTSITDDAISAAG